MQNLETKPYFLCDWHLNLFSDKHSKSDWVGYISDFNIYRHELFDKKLQLSEYLYHILSYIPPSNRLRIAKIAHKGLEGILNNTIPSNDFIQLDIGFCINPNFNIKHPYIYFLEMTIEAIEILGNFYLER